MPFHSRWSTPIPTCSLQTWVFDSPSSTLPEKLAFIDANRPDTHYLTQSSWRLWSKRVAAGLVRAGLQRGDRVLVYSGNNIFFPVLFMGILMAGGIFTGANPSFVARELEYQLRDSDARFLIAADESLEVAVEAAAAAGVGKERVLIFDDRAFEQDGRDRLGVRNWKALIASHFEGDRFEWVDPENPQTTTCCINYSSGTTGVPKGVEITHTNYVANGEQVCYVDQLHLDHEEKLKNDRVLCFLPMYHAMGQASYCAVFPKRGTPVYMMPKFDFVEVLKNIERYRITRLVVVPPIAVLFAKHPAAKQYDLSSIQSILSGAAPLSRAVSAEVEDLWPAGNVNLKQGWGMTEVTCSFCAWDPNETSFSAAVGELNPNCSAKVMNEDGTAEVPRGSRGELWCRGPNVMKGYWRKPKETADAFHDGWLKTGDVAVLDEENKIHIVDRMKELIKVKGNQVAPAELEALLLEHQALADAAVVGVVINGGEVPRAYVVLKEGQELTEKDIRNWMDDKVVRYKRLVGGIVFVDSIPKNPSGKILRKFLRELAKDEVGDKEIKDSRL